MIVKFTPNNDHAAIRIEGILCDHEGEYDLPEWVVRDFPDLFSVVVVTEKAVNAPPKNKSAKGPDHNK